MNSEVLKLFRKFVFRERLENYKKLLIFCFFLIVSTLFWFFETLGKEYTTTIIYPIKYSNIPDDKVLVSDLPNKLLLKVKSTGFKLLKHNVLYKEPLMFNYDLFLRKNSRRNSSHKVYYLTKNLKANLSAQLGTKISVIEIFPDTLIFDFEDIISKAVIVKPIVDIEFDKQYTLKGSIKSKPEKINISGINSIIDTINFIRTVSKTLYNLNQATSYTIPIVKSKGVKYYCEEVNVKVDVEKFTESSKVVNINVINVPQNVKFNIFPKKATINYYVGLSNYKNIKSSDFEITIDYNSIKTNVGTKLKVKVTKVPKIISSIKVNPAFVNYSIKR